MPLFPTSAAAQPPDEIVYNVYCIYLVEPNGGPRHEAVAVVPAGCEYQGKGRFYHVVGSITEGMRYECLPAYDFGADPAFVRNIFQFSMPARFLPALECIGRSLLEDADPPGVIDAGRWVGGVIVRLESHIQFTNSPPRSSSPESF